MCVTFVVFTDCESCTRPISTNPGSMEAGEYGPTRGTCFAAHRLELVAVTGRLWISWCVSGGAIFFRFFVRFFSVERTWPAASTRPPYLSTSKDIPRAIQQQQQQSSKPRAMHRRLVDHCVFAIHTRRISFSTPQTGKEGDIALFLQDLVLKLAAKRCPHRPQAIKKAKNGQAFP